MPIELKVPKFQGMDGEAEIGYMDRIRGEYGDRIRQAATPRLAEIRSIIEADTENPDAAEGNIWRIVQGVAQSVGLQADYGGTDMGAIEFRTVFEMVKEMLEGQ